MVRSFFQNKDHSSAYAYTIIVILIFNYTDNLEAVKIFLKNGANPNSFISIADKSGVLNMSTLEMAFRFRMCQSIL